MKFLKTLICVALAVVITISAFSVSAAAAQEGRIKQGVGYITASSLRLRSGPSTGSNTLAYGYQNEAVILLGKTGQWYHVLYNLTEGYMHESYLRTSKIENAELGYGIVNYTKVNMRTGPSTAYSRIGQSSQGDLAYVVGLNNGWYKVIWNDNICYIRSDYLTLTEVPYENRANPHAPLFFRSGKSTGTPVSASALRSSVNYRPANTAQQIIATAKQYIGVPYLWGGTSPNGFDCSGFVQYVFQKHGIHLNRTVVTQYRHGYAVSKSNLQPGDLVFFQNTYASGLSHIGIYIGNNQFIHASSSQGVTISSLSNSYWSSHYHSARRVLT